MVEIVYPEPFDPAEEQQGWSPAPESDASIVDHDGTSGVLLAFDQRILVAIAERVDVVIELVPQVGDFVARGDPLFRVRNGGRPVEIGALRASVAIGPERTMEQDPRFAFRILVDIASKALSPGINDPTTAVLALDQIHRLLMHVGKRRLDAGQAYDALGRLRLYYRTPDWIDFVSLAVTEIRHYGASSMQVARRLHILLEHLLRVLPQRVSLLSSWNSPCSSGQRSVLFPTKKIALSRRWETCRASEVLSRRSGFARLRRIRPDVLRTSINSGLRRKAFEETLSYS